MTKPISRKMAVDCLLYRFAKHDSEPILGSEGWGIYLECDICQNFIEAGQAIQFDHIHADVFDGPHEYQNLRPVHAECHKKKTAQDIKDNAKVKRLINPKPSKRPMKSGKREWPSRKFGR